MIDDEYFKGAKKSKLGLEDMVESLYNLERWELRRLAAEALLISDGPDSPHEINEQDPGTAVKVTQYAYKFGEAFAIYINEEQG